MDDETFEKLANFILRHSAAQVVVNKSKDGEITINR